MIRREPTTRIDTVRGSARATLAELPAISKYHKQALTVLNSLRPIWGSQRYQKVRISWSQRIRLPPQLL